MATSTFTIDSGIRSAAAKRARRDGISLSAVARMLLRQYADGQLHIQISNTPTAEIIPVDGALKKQMDEIGHLWNQKKSGK